MQIDPFTSIRHIFSLLFELFGSVITNDARCTREIESRTVMAKAAFKKKILFTNKLELTCNEEASALTHVEQSFVWC